jgi:hypothetical protein
MTSVVLSNGKGAVACCIGLALGVKVGVWRMMLSNESGFCDYEESLDKKEVRSCTFCVHPHD